PGHQHPGRDRKRAGFCLRSGLDAQGQRARVRSALGTCCRTRHGGRGGGLMNNPRASVFGEPSDIDLSEFAPKPKVDTKAPAAKDVRAVAEKANFRSREAAPTHIAEASPKRPARRFRTGASVPPV